MTDLGLTLISLAAEQRYPLLVLVLLPVYVSL